ncbi:hypothetical protein IQ06DRAFT_352432 [Phaeosphaeriaceae sp. SRC1lsM3a]|nr:hypothetical protein IQ06DRAFT_352432 [Stagonospora sp. SRC1lsM3a]
MGKEQEMHYLNFPSTPRKSTASRYKHILATFLLILCIPIAIYQLVPRFTHATDEIVDSLIEHIRGPEMCTSEIGNAHCCALFLDAAPCVDECRKQHVDRVTYMLTKEYDECADTCLAGYNSECRHEARAVD